MVFTKRFWKDVAVSFLLATGVLVALVSTIGSIVLPVFLLGPVGIVVSLLVSILYLSILAAINENL